MWAGESSRQLDSGRDRLIEASARVTAPSVARASDGHVVSLPERGHVIAQPGWLVALRPVVPQRSI